jgi:hypothetical protein
MVFHSACQRLSSSTPARASGSSSSRTAASIAPDRSKRYDTLEKDRAGGNHAGGRPTGLGHRIRVRGIAEVLGGVVLQTGPEVTLTLHEREAGLFDRGHLWNRPDLRDVVGGGAEAGRSLPRRTREDGQRIAFQARTRETREQGAGIRLRTFEEARAQVEFGAIEQQILSERMRFGPPEQRGDDLFQVGGRGDRIDPRGGGQAHQGDALEIGVAAFFQQLAQRLPPFFAIRTGDQAEHEQGLVAQLEFRCRHRLALPLEHGDRARLFSQPVENHRILQGKLETQRAALLPLDVCLQGGGGRLADLGQGQARLNPRQPEHRTLRLGGRRGDRPLKKLVRLGLLARPARRCAAQEIPPRRVAPERIGPDLADLFIHVLVFAPLCVPARAGGDRDRKCAIPRRRRHASSRSAGAMVSSTPARFFAPTLPDQRIDLPQGRAQRSSAPRRRV